MKNGFFQLSAMIAVLSAAFTASASDEAQPEHVPGELVIQLKKGVPVRDASVEATVKAAIKRALGGSSVVSMSPLVTDPSVYTIKLAQPAKLSQAIRALRQESAIQFAEPNYVYRTTDETPPAPPSDGTPNDPEFAKLWGMKNTGQTDDAGQVGKAGADINVLPLWQEGSVGSRDVLVAVIDTGMLWDHPDLVDNLYTNPGEAGDKAANGVDDDGNGFIDDVHGWNFAAKSNMSNDDNKHGTHCSGTIGATGNNGVGVAGVNHQVSILPIKFLTASGSGALADAIESINYARLMKAQIMSNSWGGGGFSEIMKNSIIAARDAGILFVAASGNDKKDNDRKPKYPATYGVENIVSVAAIDNLDNLAKFSNYGETTVHVAAPGVKIWSTSIKDKPYESLSGTSMACPHVSGIAALMLSGNPNLSYAEIKERLIKTSEPVAALNKKVVANGRVNAFKAFHNIVPQPQP